MIEMKKIAKAEIFDLYHKKLKKGAWQVVRCKMYSVNDAIQRMQFLQKKAISCNVTLEEFQSIIKIGAEGILEGSLNINVQTTEKRLQMRFWDYVREFLLIGFLFKVFEENQIDNSLKLLK